MLGIIGFLLILYIHEYVIYDLPGIPPTYEILTKDLANTDFCCGTFRIKGSSNSALFFGKFPHIQLQKFPHPAGQSYFQAATTLSPLIVSLHISLSILLLDGVIVV